MIRRFIVALVATPALLSAQVTSQSGVAALREAPRAISLDEAVRLAQRNAPATVQARNAIRTNNAAVQQARSQFLPQVTMSANGTRQGGDRFNPQGELVPFTGQAWQYGSSLNANMDLFSGFRRYYDLKAANADVVSAESNETVQRFRVALDVKQQYYNVLAAREQVIAARAQLEQTEQQLRAAVARVAAGAATMSDSLRSVIQVGNAQLQLLTAQNTLNNANVALTRLIATPYIVTADSMSNESFELALDSAQLVEIARRGPTVLQAEAQLASSRAAVKSARGTYFPTLNMSYGRSGGGFDSKLGWGDERYAYSDNLRFGISFPIFDRWNREAGVIRAKAAEDNAEATLRNEYLLALQNIISALGNLRTAEQRVRIQELSVSAAEEDLRVQQQRYSLGASTLLDLLTSQTALNNARQALIQARLDARVAKAQIEALVGRDL